MFPEKTRSLLAKTFLLSWAIICIIVFINLPGSVSILYGSTMAAWPSFLPKLARIDLSIYILDLLKAIAGILIFSLAGISVWVSLPDLPSWRTKIYRAHRLADKKSALPSWLDRVCYQSFFLVLGMDAQLTPEKVLFTLAGSLLIGIPLLIKFLSEQMRTKRSIKTDERSNGFDQMLTWLISSVSTFQPAVFNGAIKLRFGLSVFFRCENNRIDP